jgi:hypothetical protein
VIGDRRFAVEHVAIGRVGGALRTDGRPLAIMAMETPLTLDVAGTTTSLDPWQTAIVPASDATVSLANAGAASAALVVHVQPDLAALRAEAAAAGIAPHALDGFFAQFA